MLCMKWGKHLSILALALTLAFIENGGHFPNSPAAQLLLRTTSISHGATPGQAGRQAGRKAGVPPPLVGCARCHPFLMSGACVCGASPDEQFIDCMMNELWHPRKDVRTVTSTTSSFENQCRRFFFYWRSSIILTHPSPYIKKCFVKKKPRSRYLDPNHKFMCEPK